MGIWKPSNFRVIQHMEDSDLAGGSSPGGLVRRGTAGGTLNIGDFVALVPGINRWFKTLGSSYYAACPTGIVVGGKKTDFMAVLDSGPVNSIAAAAIGEDVLVMTRGICYGIVDATGIKAGAPISAGRTTAGRIIGDMKMSFAENVPGLQNTATAGILVAEIANATRLIKNGVLGTNAAAGLDLAALAGTVLNAQFGLWEQRVDSDGITVTTAAGLLTAATKAALTLPAGSASLITLGFLIVNPTGTGNFVGGTTALNDATVVPNAEYHDLVGQMHRRGTALANGGAAGAALLIELH